jgi:hypothetical protein
MFVLNYILGFCVTIISVYIMILGMKNYHKDNVVLDEGTVYLLIILDFIFSIALFTMCTNIINGDIPLISSLISGICAAINIACFKWGVVPKSPAS